MPSQCVRCKGMKMLCGRTTCPLLIQMRSRKELGSSLVENELIGESPSVFIGSYSYPKVFIGPLTGKNLSMEDESSKWYGTPLERIIQHRSSLFRGKDAVRIDEAKNPSRRLQTIQEIAMSERSVDTDVVFKKTPKLEISFSSVSAPFGPAGETQSVALESNPRIPRAVDKIVNDELKAVEGITGLYERGITMDEIQKILSVGLLGINKKLVPTRWSITASDDTVCKKMLCEIKEHDEISEYQVYESNYLDNHFQILLMPGKWSFEQIEYYAPGSIWVKKNEAPVFMTDYENFKGRKKYAENVAGGYYAGRLGVCEYLRRMKKQASVIIIREIGSGYYVPVGVWQVRESVRKALQNKPEKYNTLKEAFEKINKGFIVGSKWEKHSELLKKARSREILKSFIS